MKSSCESCECFLGGVIALPTITLFLIFKSESSSSGTFHCIATGWAPKLLGSCGGRAEHFGYWHANEQFQPGGSHRLRKSKRAKYALFFFFFWLHTWPHQVFIQNKMTLEKSPGLWKFWVQMAGLGISWCLWIFKLYIYDCVLKLKRR